MAYLGNDLQVAYSTYKNIDDISGSFNGSTTSFALLVGGVAPVPLPLNSQQCLISVGGVIQRPDDTGAEGFRLSGGNIVFSSAPSTGEDFFGVILAGADYVNVGANFPSGSAAVPSITFDSDLDTGIYNSAANNIAIATGGTQRLVVDSSGRLGLGTSSPAVLIHGSVSSGAATARLESTANSGEAGLQLYGKNSGGTVRVGQFKYDSTDYFRIGTTGAVAFAFETSDTERMRIDSSGRVGIGSTAPLNIFDVKPSTNRHIIFSPSSSYANNAVVGVDDAGNEIALGIAGNPIQFFTGAAERARIDSSGRLLVGTSTTTGVAKLQVQGYVGDDSGLGLLALRVGSSSPTNGSALGRIDFNDSTDSRGASIGVERDGGTWGASSKPSRLVFSTTADGASSPTERMRLQANGKLLLGTTSSNYGNFYQLEVDGGAGDAQLNKTSAGAGAGCFSAWNSATSGNNGFVFFFTESSITLRGSIDYNRAAGQVRYNVTSDRRLKSDIQDAGSALSILNQIKVRSYIWTETGYGVEYGFVAQELNEVAPDAVKVGDDGEEVVDTWAVDNAKLVPLLTKALQEALAEIASLKDRVAALEAS